MLYLKVEEDDKNKLIMYCKNCGYKSMEKKDAKNGCIYKADYSEQTDLMVYNTINKYTVYDPTLPRVSNIECPNDTCPTKSGEDKEVIYIKYNMDEMKYIYVCCKCETAWKNPGVNMQNCVIINVEN
tara:strand:- start:511 stop:891 length:381 start_codon:yes stop_codon:yes gene_type:complete